MNLPVEFKLRMQEYLQNNFSDFLKSYELSPIRGLRVNIEKIDCTHFLALFPYPCTPISYAKDGFYLETEEKVGNHPYHHAGMFYLQDASAIGVVNAIVFQPNWTVLDLCAAPGGKTSQISTMIPQGTVLANEIVPQRSKILLSNIERLGLKNVIVSCNTSQNLKELYPNTFDAIFVDAPCSGEGMFRKDPKTIMEWSLSNIQKCTIRDMELLEHANIMLKQNGILVYSTCTYSKEENEETIALFLQKHHYSLLEVTENVKKATTDGLSTDFDTTKCRRFYPHITKGEGQFVAVLQKLEENNHTRSIKNTVRMLLKGEQNIVYQALEDNLLTYDLPLYVYNNHVVTIPTIFPVSEHNIVSYGVRVGDIEKNRFLFHHQFFSAYGFLFKRKLSLSCNDKRVEAYLRGEEIKGEKMDDGFGVILLDSVSLGGFKASNGNLKNHYPKGLRKR